MSFKEDIKNGKVPAVKINPELDKYDAITLFPEKYANAVETLRRIGPPQLPADKHTGAEKK